jgi:hypothetical protein
LTLLREPTQGEVAFTLRFEKRVEEGADLPGTGGQFLDKAEDK